MLRNRLLLVALAFLVTVSSAWAERPEKLVRVKVTDPNSQAMREFLRTGPDVAGYDPRSHTLVVFARARDLQKLKDLGLGYEVEIENLAAVERQMRTSGYFDHFHDYARCKQELEWAETNYPELAKVYDIGDGWEKTQGLADRDILAIKISDNVAEEENEPEVLILSNHHAREIITPEIAVYMIHYLLENYGKDPYVTYLVDHRQIWIIPTMNPDGLDYVFYHDRWWRKNRRDNGDGTFGVDLNRNYAYKWGYNNVGSSPDPRSDVYRGTGPFSEPETQAIRGLCDSHRFRIILSYHSYSQLYLYPWGYVAKNTPDNYVFVALADSMAHYNGYLPGNVASGAIYLTNGDSDDWFYGEQTEKNKIFGLTVEVGTSFHPDTTQIMPQILENLWPNLYAIWAVGEEPIVSVLHVPNTENANGPYQVRARIQPAVTLTDSCVLDPERFFLHYSFDGATWDSVQMAATDSVDVYAASVPGRGSMGPVYFYVTAWSVDGRRGAWPRPAPAAVDSFLVTEDLVAPTISHNPLPDQSVYSGAYKVVARLYDDSGIDSAWVEYWLDGPVFAVPLVREGDTFVGTIRLNPPVAGETGHYRIYARDASAHQNLAVAPRDGAYEFRILDYRIFDLESDSLLQPVSGADWEWGVPTSGPRVAHSGFRVWATKLDGKYSNNADDRLNTPPIDLRAAEHPIFQFWHWYDFEYSQGRLWDGGNLKISVDGGPLELINTVVGGYDHTVDSYNRVVGGQPAFGGPPGTGDFWHPTYVDLSPYVGHTVVIQFHFGSDAYSTEQGWYIDDVGWKVFEKGAPQVSVVERPRNTSDVAGPYRVTANAWDDSALASVTLYYMVGGDSEHVEMESAGNSLFTGLIPGQPLGSEVRFYVEAVDSSGNVSRDPVGAPRVTYSFEVTDSQPSASVYPAGFEYRLRADSAVVDTLWLRNDGKIDLFARLSVQSGGGAAAVSAPAVTPPSADVLRLLSSRPVDWEKLRWRKGRLPEFSETTTTRGGQPRVSAERRGDFTVVSWEDPVEVLQLKLWPGGGEYLLQLRPDRSELAVLDASREQPLVLLPARKIGAKWTAVLPDGILDSRWAKIGIWAWERSARGWHCAESNVAGATPLPWLEAKPDSVLVPGGARYPLRVEVSALGLVSGTYDARILIQTNDPQSPELYVPVRLTVESATSVQSAGGKVPVAFRLFPAYPNPFNPGTTFRYAVAKTGDVRLEIFNSRSERVRTLVRQRRGPGVYRASWDGRDDQGRQVAAGVYLCRMTVRAEAGLIWQSAEKLLLLR